MTKLTECRSYFAKAVIRNMFSLCPETASATSRDNKLSLLNPSSSWDRVKLVRTHRSHNLAVKGILYRHLHLLQTELVMFELYWWPTDETRTSGTY